MKRLGVFDSGLGGFNIVNELRQHTSIDMVFLADHKNLPYGLKEDEELKEILKENMQWFKDKGIHHVLIACNTASNFIDYLRDCFPDMTLDSIIEITSKQFTDEDLILFGTNVTCNSKKYDDVLNKKQSYHPLPKLASLVEENDDSKTRKYLKEELKQYKGQKNNYLLACTHYSIVEEMFSKYLDGFIYDSVAPTLEYYEDLEGENTLELYTTGNIKKLRDELLSIYRIRAEVIPHTDKYKIILVSDNHGRYDPLVQVLNDHKDAHAFIHCGDVEFNDPILDNFYVVNGNNDYYSPFDDHITLDINQLRIYITHGHEYARFSRYKDLYEHAKSINADFVCYGHEHIFKESYIDGMLLINPGSLFYNRDQTPQSYAILWIDGKDITVERVNLGE